MQAQTWPRNAATPTKENMGNSTENLKPHSPTDKPSVAEKPGSNAPQRAATLSDRHSHPERPHCAPLLNGRRYHPLFVPPQSLSSSASDRPKIPPPVVPNHQRSASAGSASNLISASVTPDLAFKTQSSENDEGRLSSMSRDSVDCNQGNIVLNAGMIQAASAEQLSNTNRMQTQNSPRPVRPQPPIPPHGNKDPVQINIETEQTRL